MQSSVLFLATQTCKSQMETVRCDELRCYQYYSDVQFYVSTSKPNRADSLVTCSWHKESPEGKLAVLA